MRILQVVHDFLPLHVAGVEVYTDLLSRYLSRDHDVAILCSEVRPEMQNFSVQRREHKGVPVYELVNNQRIRNFRETYRHHEIDAQIESVLEEFQPDVIHLQHLLNLSFGLVDAAKRRGIPVLMTLHDHWLECANGGQRYRVESGRCESLDARQCGTCTAHMNRMGFAARGLLARLEGDKSRSAITARAISLGRRGAARLGAARQTRRIRARWSEVHELAEKINLFVAPSRYLRDEFVRFGFPDEKVVHSDYGFDIDQFDARRSISERVRSFGFVGSLVPHKGVHILLQAFARLPKDATLDVCGALHYAPAYSAGLQANANHSGVRFTGGISPEQVPAFLKTIDCLIVPSIWQENSPLTIHEAFMAGIPVVAARMGGMVELIRDGGGLLYDPDDPGALHACLQRLYEEPGLARSLASSAAPVKSIKENAGELVAFYESIAERASETALP
jgi:glycosyltransferase involved in cell wall biosynthesis